MRCKRKRRLDKYAKPFKFKRYNEIEVGENMQIDYMMVTKNELKALSNMFLLSLIAKQIALMLLNFYEN